FSYEDRGVLEEVSFRLEPGRSLGLLGRTGGGKTTITRLISRLYDPDQGLVRLGDVDLRSADRLALRRVVGVVTQEVQLFRGTVRDNLCFFDRNRSDDEIMRVLERDGLGGTDAGLGLDTE